MGILQRTGLKEYAQTEGATARVLVLRREDGEQTEFLLLRCRSRGRRSSAAVRVLRQT